MPFPALFVWGAAAAIGALGVKKGYDAYCDNSDACEIGKDAESKYKNAQADIEKHRYVIQQTLSSLGELKASVFKNQIGHLVNVQKKFRTKIDGYDQTVYIDDLPQVESMVEKATEIASSIGHGCSGAATGALLSLGTYGLVGTFATTSAGTAIGTLSGAAATNATLAWLGGGALSAGGFGMAGGMVALGGIALAPLLAIGGFWAASKAEEAKTEAWRYAAKVDKAVAEMEQFKAVLNAIKMAAEEQTNIIKKTVDLFESIKVDNLDDKGKFKKMFILGKGIKDMLNIPVITDKGVANENIRIECEGCLKLGY